MDTPAFMNPFAVTCLSVLLSYLILQITVCLVMAKGFQVLKKQANNHNHHTETLGNLQFPDPVEQVLFPVPTIHPLQPPPALSGQGVTGRHSGENSA